MKRIRCAIFILLTALLMVSSPVFAQSLTLQGSVTLPACQAVDAVGSTVYTATISDFIVVNAASPGTPVVVGQVATGTGSISAISVAGNYAYCAGQAAGLIVVSVSDPAHPVITRQFVLTSSARGVAAQDTLVAVATANSVILVGVRVPSDPHVLTSYARQSSWVEFDPAGNRLHVGSIAGAFDLAISTTIQSGDTSFHLINSHSYGTSPATPLAVAGSDVDVVNGAVLAAIHTSDYGFVGQYQATGAIRCVAGISGFAFIGVAPSSAVMVDQRAGVPVFAASTGIPSEPTGVTVAQAGSQSLLAVSHHSGVSILAYQALSASEIPAVVPKHFALSAYPNPFNSSAELRLRVPAPGQYDLAVYNSLGREVRREMLNLSGDARYHLDFAGQSGGIYFARLARDNQVAATKLLYLP
jgi:hypothetical protein